MPSARRCGSGSARTCSKPSRCISLSTATAIRAAVMAGAGPAVLSSLAVREDLSRGQLVAIPVVELELHRSLRVIWQGDRQPPAGAARDLVGHITTQLVS